MSGSLINTYNNVAFALNQHTAAMAKLQEQSATDSKINTVSDAPAAAYQLLSLRTQSSSLQRYRDNIVQASDTLEITSNVLGNMINQISSLQVSVTQISSGTYTQSGREMVAEEINDALEQMLSYANTDYLGQYVFGGGMSSTQPYTAEKVDGRISSVSYQGSEQSRDVAISRSVQTTVMYCGQDLFAAGNRGDTVFYGDTGAAAGSGTSKIDGDVFLTVTNDGTNYKLSIDGGATEVTVPASGDISNIAVTDADGNVLYVDATNITATGKNLVTQPGSYDIFNSLISLRDILENTEDISDSQINEFRDAISSSLQEVSLMLTDKQIAIGSKIGFLEDLDTNIENIQLNAEKQSASIAEADVAQIAIDLTLRKALYEMSLSVAGNLLSISLLDFI